MGGDLLLNLLAAALWVALGATATRIIIAIRKRRRDAFARFTDIPPGAKRVHIVYGLIERSQPIESYTLEEGDVAALCVALSLVQERYGAEATCPVNAYAARPTFASYTNMLLVSGPIWNSLTKYYLDQGPSYFEFAQEVDAAAGRRNDVLTITSGGTTTILRTIRSNGIPRECFGLVLSGQFPPLRKGPPQRVTIAAGISPLGTFGAVHWLGSLGGRKLEEVGVISVARRPTWRCAVIKVEDKSPKGFRSYAAELDKPGFLSLHVEAYQEGT